MTETTTKLKQGLTELLARRAEARRPALERLVATLQENRRQALARRYPDWSDEELALLVPLGEKLRAGHITCMEATVAGRLLIPYRSWEAVWKKFKNYVNHGVWKP